MFTPTKTIHTALIHRGYSINSIHQGQRLIFNENALESDVIDEFYINFRHSGLRKIARQILGSKGNAITLDKLRDTAGASLEKYMGLLKQLGCIICSDRDVQYQGIADNLGGTLEWYVARLIEHKLYGSADWGIHLVGLPSESNGGDYDVLGVLGTSLISIETKSKRHTDISESELRHFLQRSVELAPDLAILLIDTDKPIDELLWKITDIMLPPIRVSSGISANWRPEKPLISAQSDLGFDSINYGFRRIYIVNSQPGILDQISRCLRHHEHSSIKDATLPSGPPINFITGEVKESILPM